jgi:WD40 repeat protein
VYGAAFSPNGAILVTGGTDGRIKVWTNANGTLTAQGPVLAGTGLGAVAFSPDGASLAVGRIGGVDIVTVSSWTVARTLVTTTGLEAYAVGFSPDGTTVFTTTAPSGGTGVTGTLYAHTVGNTTALASQTLTSPFGMAVSPVNVSGGVPVAVTDGNGVASIYDWSAAAKSFGTPVALTVTADASTAEASAFSPQATVFASGGDDGILSLWNYPTSSNALPDGQVSITGQTFSDYVGSVVFSPIYGYFVVGGEEFGSLTAYTLTDGSQVGVEYDTSYDVIALAYSPTSNVIVGGEYDCGCVVVCPQ